MTMTTKQSNQHCDDIQFHDEIEYAFYCDSLEEQYKQATEDGVFEILRVLKLDKEHSDKNLVQAIDYFNENGGVIEKGAPIDFLTEREKNEVNKDGKFRSGLYCMLLSIKFSEAINNKSAYILHSYKYAFDSE